MVGELALDDAIREVLRASREKNGPERTLAEAMDAAIFANSERIHGRLCLEVAEALGAAVNEAARLSACAIEILKAACICNEQAAAAKPEQTNHPAAAATAPADGKSGPVALAPQPGASPAAVGQALTTLALNTLTRVYAFRPGAGMLAVIRILGGADPNRSAGAVVEAGSARSMVTFTNQSLFQAAAAFGAMANDVVPVGPYAEFGRAFGKAYALGAEMKASVEQAPSATNRKPAANESFDTVAYELLGRACSKAAEAVPVGDHAPRLRRFTLNVLETQKVDYRRAAWRRSKICA